MVWKGGRKNLLSCKGSFLRVVSGEPYTLCSPFDKIAT